MPHRFPTHNYRLSTLAYQGLADKLLANKPQSRATLHRRRPQVIYNGSTIDHYDAPDGHIQGVGWALTLLARSHDLYEWTPAPQYHPEKPGTLLYYTPYDTDFMAEYDALSLDDLRAALDTMPDWQIEEYKLQCSLRRKQRRLSLDKSTRSYYAALLQFYQIPLWPNATHPDSLTTRVSVVLEAIGTDHLLLPEDYLSSLDQPNKRLAHYTTHSGSTKKYGNHAHTPWLPREWRKLPSLNEPWTQADVDYAVSHNLADLAREAVQLNPNLTLPANTPVAANQPTSQPTSAQASQPKREYHQQLASEPLPKPYLYKGRDVTEAVLEAYELHYERGIPLKRAPTLSEYNIPYLPLYNMIRREYVKRQIAKEDTNAASTSPSTSTQTQATDA